MLIASRYSPLFFFFNDTATTEIYPLPLHDALPIPFDAPASGASARFAGGSRQARVLTDAQGLARSPALTATGTAGSFTVSAGVEALPGGVRFTLDNRSEERRVGKECRSRWSPYH